MNSVLIEAVDILRDRWLAVRGGGLIIGRTLVRRQGDTRDDLALEAQRHWAVPYLVNRIERTIGREGIERIIHLIG